MNNVALIDPMRDSRWDDFVKTHPWGWICHHSGWKRVLETSFRHIRGHYLALFEENGEISAGLPLFEVRSWLTGNRLVSIPFATLGDPLVGSELQMRNLLDAAVGLSNQLGISKIEVRALNAHPLIQDKRFVARHLFKHHYLELRPSPEDLKKTFHYKAVRYEINKALKGDLTLTVADCQSDLSEFYRLHTATRGRLGLPPQPYRFFQTLWDVFWPLDMVTLLLAKHKGQLIAGQFYFKFNDRVSMEFEAWDRGRCELAPNHFLIWEAIKQFHAEGYRIFDFGRTSKDNVPLMDFKRRWGTTVVDLPTFYYPADKAATLACREESTLYRLANSLCRRAPGCFALEVIGRFSYRHLG